MYEAHELLTNGYRVRGNKLYYFGADGAMVTKKTRRDKSTRYIDFNRDGSVHYIYPAGYGNTDERYNAKRTEIPGVQKRALAGCRSAGMAYGA